MSVPRIPVYIIYNTDGEVQVKSSCQQSSYRKIIAGETEGLPEWAEGFKGVEGTMGWQAQRAIARMYRDAGGQLLGGGAARAHGAVLRGDPERVHPDREEVPLPLSGRRSGGLYGDGRRDVQGTPAPIRRRLSLQLGTFWGPSWATAFGLSLAWGRPVPDRG
jgi:hypothetical protein